MAYNRNSWTADEIKRCLSNPVSSATGPHAHSSMHAVDSELAKNPKFQQARTSAIIHDATHKESNLAAQQALNAQKAAGTISNTQYKKQIAKVPLPDVDASKHSTLDAVSMSTALSLALNHVSMQPHLLSLDNGNDIKVHVNYTNSIGKGYVHEQGQPSRGNVDFKSLFVYLKPNPGNRDLPIFQTVVPSENHKAGGGDPIITVP